MRQIERTIHFDQDRPPAKFWSEKSIGCELRHHVAQEECIPPNCPRDSAALARFYEEPAGAGLPVPTTPDRRV